MAPGTNVGAAHPVDLGGELAGAVEEKAVNDATAFLRSLAERRDRDVEFAVAAVRQSESITATEAEERGVIEMVATSINDLLRQLDGRTVTTETGPVTLRTQGQDISVRFHEPGLLTRILHTVTDPTIAY